MKKTLLILFLLHSFLFGCKSVYTEPDWIGLHEQAIINKLGTPTAEQILNLNKSSKLYEYQSNLYQLFPDLNEETIEVKEMIWKKKGKTTAIWCQKESTKWVVIDTLIWKDDVKF